MTTPASADTHSTLKQQTADGTSWQDILRFITGGYYINNSHYVVGGVACVKPVLPEAITQPYIQARSAILHSNSGPGKTSWYSIWKYWSRTDITGESHFQVEGVDGDAILVGQIPLNRRADCNAKANSWWFNNKRYGAISFETQDRGFGTLDNTPWSLGQLHAMIGALTCICVVYGMSCGEPTRWDDGGIGYHSRFAEWSIYIGKTCPGRARINQMAYIRQAVANNLAAFAGATGWQCAGTA